MRHKAQQILNFDLGFKKCLYYLFVYGKVDQTVGFQIAHNMSHLYLYFKGLMMSKKINSWSVLPSTLSSLVGHQGISFQKTESLNRSWLSSNTSSYFRHQYRIKSYPILQFASLLSTLISKSANFLHMVERINFRDQNKVYHNLIPIKVV